MYGTDIRPNMFAQQYIAVVDEPAQAHAQFADYNLAGIKKAEETLGYALWDKPRNW